MVIRHRLFVLATVMSRATPGVAVVDCGHKGVAVDSGMPGVWQRPGLDLKTRSLITVAMLTALGKQHELKGHVRGALNNGATPAEISEVLLHASIYCGLPTAVEAFRTAAEVVDAPKAP